MIVCETTLHGLILYSILISLLSLAITIFLVFIDRSLTSHWNSCIWRYRGIFSHESFKDNTVVTLCDLHSEWINIRIFSTRIFINLAYEDDSRLKSYVVLSIFLFAIHHHRPECLIKHFDNFAEQTE